MKHVEHLCPLVLIEMQEHVLADDQAQPVDNRRERQQIVRNGAYGISDVCNDSIFTLSPCGFEISLDVRARHPLQLIIRVDGILEYSKNTLIVVAGNDFDIAKHHRTQILSQKHGERKGLLPHCTTGIPDANAASSRNLRQEMADRQFEAFQISKEE